MEKNSQKRPERIIFFSKDKTVDSFQYGFWHCHFDKKKSTIFAKKIWKGCDSLILIDFAEIVREAKAIRLSPPCYIIVSHAYSIVYHLDDDLIKCVPCMNEQTLMRISDG